MLAEWSASPGDRPRQLVNFPRFSLSATEKGKLVVLQQRKSLKILHLPRQLWLKISVQSVI
jgi:hypothetical protein